MKTAEGTGFQSLPTFSYVVNFGEGQLLTVPEAPLSSLGLASFSFVIPPNTTRDQATIAFSINYQGIRVPYTRVVTIVQP